jgi:ankyrin repeat protein
MKQFMTIVFIMFDSVLVFGASQQQIEAIHRATIDGRLDEVQKLLSEGIDVNVKNSSYYDYTPLHVAAWQGHLDIARLLLSKGAAIEANSDFGTPLHVAANYGHAKFAELLLDDGANVEAQTKDRVTPLHEAASKCQLDVLKLLLARGAQVDAQDINHNTALHRAVEQADLNAARELLLKGASITIQGQGGSSPRDCARHFGNQSMIDLFEEHLSMPITLVIAFLGKNSECAVCLRSMFFGPVKHGQCGHTFHNDCIERWTGQNPTCPMCRAHMPLESLVNGAYVKPSEAHAQTVEPERMSNEHPSPNTHLAN